MHKLTSSLALVALFLAACAADSTLPGSWIMDNAASVRSLEAAMRAKLKVGPESETLKKTMEAIATPMKQMRVEYEIKPDGTFIMHSDNPDGSHEHVKGKWTLTGNQVTMTGKWEKSEKEETYSGTLAGDELRLGQTQDGLTVEMVFRRTK